MAEEFNIVSCQENQDSLKKLIKLIESRRAVLFLGSGPSRNLGYPSWVGLIRQLSTQILDEKVIELIEKNIEKDELLVAAEILRAKIPKDSFFKMFSDTFKPNSVGFDDLHQKLVKLNFKAFVTTNYDTVLEQALKSIQKPTRNYGLTILESSKSSLHLFINQLAHDESLDERYQLYLHGKYDNSDSVVLSYGDYSKKYDGLEIDQAEFYYDLLNGKISIKDFEDKTNLKINGFRTLHFKIIYLLFLTQKIVFIGFGLHDPYLNKIIEEVKEDFNPFHPNHFALFSSEEGKNLNSFEYQDQKRYWRERGIDLIFYDDDPGYQGLEKFIDRIPPDCFIQPKSFQPKETIKNVESIAETPQKDLKSILFAKTRETISEIKTQ